MNNEIKPIDGESDLTNLDPESSLKGNSVARGAVILGGVVLAVGFLAYGASSLMGSETEQQTSTGKRQKQTSAVPAKDWGDRNIPAEVPAPQKREGALEVVIVEEEEEVIVPSIKTVIPPPPLPINQATIVAPTNTVVASNEAIPMMPALDKSRSSLMVATGLTSRDQGNSAGTESREVVEVAAQYRKPVANADGTVTDEFSRNTTRRTSSQETQIISPVIEGQRASVGGRSRIAQKRDTSLVLSRGSYIDCVLNTQLNSQLAGITKCQVLHNVFSDNGDVLLIERGSVVTGDYERVQSQGINRILIKWTRIRTPEDVLIDLDSQATDSVGSVGISGFYNNHTFKRFGGALMVSIINDAFKFAVAQEIPPNPDGSSAAEETTDSGKVIVQEILTLYAGIRPTVEIDRGSRVGIMVANDLDFSEVYSIVNE